MNSIGSVNRDMLDDEWLLDEFESAWRSSKELSGAPSIEDFLHRGVLKGLPELQTLSELVRVDMEYRFSQAHATDRDVASYQQEFQDRLPLTADLFADEFRLRQRFGKLEDFDWTLSSVLPSHFISEAEYNQFTKLCETQRNASVSPINAFVSKDTNKFSDDSDPDETHVKDNFDGDQSDDEAWCDLDERYERRRLLGEGSFGVVWEAFDRQLQRRVAVKILRSRGPMSEIDLASFVHEARSAASLQHPNLLTIHDVIVRDRFVALVTQLIEGVSLEKWWERETARGGTTLDLAKLMRNIVEAVHHAHLAGLIHCDLKPRNILVDEDGKATILDFGLAIRRDGEQPIEGAIAGTPAFMSPEQTWGDTHHLDGRTDIWSLGAIIYRLLTGRSPFVAPTTEALFEAIQSRELVPIGQICEDVPERLRQICQCCLSKRVTDRYETAGHLAQAIGDFIAEQQAGSDDSNSTMATFRESRFRRISGRIVSLPWRPIDLIGRDETIRSVTETLNEGRDRLITLTGVGGVGKTETAIAVAHQLSESFEGDVAWVDLAAVRDEEQLAASVLSAMQVISTATVSSSHLVIQALVVRGPVVLVLDNLEQVVDIASPLVVEWLAQCRNLSLLTTSQLPLRVRGEQVIPLHSLDIESTGEAVELFVQRARIASTRFVCDDSNRKLVAQVCQLVEGNPLAIELAASRMGLMTLRDLHRRLAQSFSILRSASGDRPARHKTLQEVVRWSFDLLSQTERNAVMRLAIWPSPLSSDLAERMLDSLEADPFLVLEELRQRQLIRVAEGDDRIQFSVSTVVQRFAIETIKPDLRSDVCRLLIEKVLETGSTDDSPDPGLAANLWTAIEYLLDCPDETIRVNANSETESRIRITTAMLHADSLAGDEWGLPVRIKRLRRCELLGTLLQKSDLRVRLADSLRRVGEIEQAEVLATEVLKELADSTTQPTASVRNKADRLLALMSFRKGHSDEAIARLEESRRTIDSFTFPEETLDTTLELAEFHRRVGRFDKTRSLLAECKTLLPLDSDSFSGVNGSANASDSDAGLNDLARILRWTIESGKLSLQSGRIEDALSKFSEAVSQADTAPLLPWIGQALLGRAAARAESGDLEGAERDYARSEKLSRRLGDLPTLAQSINNRAIAYDDAGEAQRCVETLDEALAIYRRLDDSIGIAIATAAKAAAYLQLERPFETIRLLEHDEVVANLAPDSIHQAIRLGDLGSAQFMTGDHESSRESCERAIRILDELGVGDSSERFIYTVLRRDIFMATENSRFPAADAEASRLAAPFLAMTDSPNQSKIRRRVAMALMRLASSK